MVGKKLLSIAALAAVALPGFAMSPASACGSCHRAVRHHVARRVYRSPIVYRTTTKIIEQPAVLLPTQTVITQPAIIEQPAVLEPTIIEQPAVIERGVRVGSPNPFRWMHRTFAPWL